MELIRQHCKPLLNFLVPNFEHFRNFGLAFLTFLFLFTLPPPILAQTSNVWTFGVNTGLDFNKDPVEVFHPTNNTTGTCATICDEKGNLLLYTDGVHIYNRYYEVIQNNAFIDSGHVSQDGLILPDTKNNDSFYVFMNEVRRINNSSVQGIDLYCYVLDMSDSLKKGRVVRTMLVQKGMYMGMLAIKNKNDKDIWIITEPNRDSIYAYLLDKNGLNNPVKSYRKATILDSSNSGIKYLMLKASHDGTKIVETLLIYGIHTPFSSIGTYDFDNATGKLTNQQVIDSQAGSSSFFHAFASSEFSPNDSLFYVTDWGYKPNPPNGEYLFPLRQYSRYASDIPASVQYLPLTRNSGIQLGPDGRIYVANINAPYLSVIHYPNNVGTSCHIVSKEIDLQSKGTWWYSFPNVFYRYIRASFSYIPSCSKNEKFTNLSDTDVFKKFTWYFNSTDSIAAYNPGHSYPKTGYYFVKLKAQSPQGFVAWYSDSIFYIKVKPSAKYGCTSDTGCQYVAFNLYDSSYTDTIGSHGQTWSWDFGDGSPLLTYSGTKRPLVSHIYTQNGVYTVTLVYGNGLCTDTFASQKKVVIIPAPKPGFSVSDTLGCVPLTVNVKDESVGLVDKWVYVIGPASAKTTAGKRDSLQTPSLSYNFASAGKYMIHQYLTGPTGCVTEDSVMINATPVFLSTDKTDISNVTVDTLSTQAGYNVVDINWLPYTGATNYYLYRYMDYDTSYEALLVQTSHITYQDNSIDPGIHSYTYFIKAADGCGHYTSHGRIGKTIKLSGFENGNLLSQLVWTPYKDWVGGVSSYEIRREDPGNGFKLIGTANDTSYEDLQAINLYGECYRVMASSTDTGIKSFSNVFCFGNSPQIFIPNIFTPNGDTLNDMFAPVCMGIKQWDMTIINRWGEKIYTSSAPLKGTGKLGWDGSFKGITSPNGIYIYYIKAEDYDGNAITRKGMVMLQQ